MGQIKKFLLAAFMPLSMVVLVKFMDMDDFRRALIMVYGSIGFLYVAIKGNLNSVQKIFVCGAIVAVAQALLSYIPGHTIVWMAYLISAIGIVFIAMKMEAKHVAAAIVLLAVSECLRNYAVRIDWKDEFGRYMSFGSFRNPARFASVMYLGVLACFYLFKNKSIILKAALTVLAGGFTVCIWHSQSHIAILLTVVTGIIALNVRINNRALKIVSIIAVVTALGVAPKQYRLDDARKGWWKDAITASVLRKPMKVLFGSGMESWELNVENIVEELPYPSHPHNEVLHVLHDFGVFGVFAFAALLLVAFLGMCDWYAKTSLIGVLVIALTNSLRYPEQVLLFAVFVGLCTKNIRDELCDIESSVFYSQLRSSSDAQCACTQTS